MTERKRGILLAAPGYSGLAVLVGGGAVIVWAFCRGAFAMLVPSPGARWGTLLLFGIWVWYISIVPPTRTIQGDRFLALLYWNNALPGRFLDASRRVIEESGDREERLRYAKQGVYTAFEIMKEPDKARWFYTVYVSMGGERDSPSREK